MTLFMMAVLMMPSLAEAQDDGTFNRQTLKRTGGNNAREQRIDRKTKQEPVTPTAQPKSEVKTEKPSGRTDGMTITNPCSDWLEFEFVELVGSTSEQTASMTFRVTNHDINKRMRIGHDILAYDQLGGEHSCFCGEWFDTKTDVMISYTMEIPDKMLPSKVKKLTFISFKVDDCTIEMRNVPIEWR